MPRVNLVLAPPLHALSEEHATSIGLSLADYIRSLLASAVETRLYGVTTVHTNAAMQPQSVPSVVVESPAPTTVVGDEITNAAPVQPLVTTRYNSKAEEDAATDAALKELLGDDYASTVEPEAAASPPATVVEPEPEPEPEVPWVDPMKAVRDAALAADREADKEKLKVYDEVFNEMEAERRAREQGQGQASVEPPVEVGPTPVVEAAAPSPSKKNLH